MKNNLYIKAEIDGETFSYIFVLPPRVELVARMQKIPVFYDELDPINVPTRTVRRKRSHFVRTLSTRIAKSFEALAAELEKRNADRG